MAKRHINVYANGATHEMWFDDNDNYHRNNGPAIISRNCNGIVVQEMYLIHGELHCIEGPAFINYENNEKWFRFYGKEFNSLEELQRYIKCQIIN